MPLKLIFNPVSGQFDEVSEVALAAVGSTPNANAASISASQVLNLQPADASFPGVISTSAQDIPGAKTFLEPIVIESDVSDAIVRYEPSGAITPSNPAWEAGFEAGQPYYAVAMDNGSIVDPFISFGLNGIISVVSPKIFYSDNIRADNIATPAGAEVINVTSRELKDTTSAVVAEFTGPTLVLTVGIDSVATGGTDSLDIGATNADVINIGHSGDPVNVLGSVLDLSADLNLQGATSGNFTQRAAAVTTDYSVSWPAAQGGASDVLTNDGSGNLSWAPAGGSTATSFSLANNQVSPADVTGFLVNSASFNGFVAEFNIIRETSIAAIPATGIENTTFATAIGTGFTTFVNVQRADRQSDDKIIAPGSFTDFNGNTRNYLARLNPDGTDDSTFYTNLTSTGDNSGFNTTTRFALVLSNGKILVGGNFVTLNGNTRNRIVLLDSDGTENTTFATNVGTAFTGSTINAIELPSSKILIVGAYTEFNGNGCSSIVVLNFDGTEDAAFTANFGTGLEAATDAENAYRQADGKILIGGGFTTFNGGAVAPGLVRLNSDGTEDTTFTTALGTGFNNTVFSVIEIASTDIVVGGAFTDFDGNACSKLVKLSSAGVFDTTFDGNLGTSFSSNAVSDITEQDDGAIIVTGNYGQFDGNGVQGMVRLSDVGIEDATFSTNLGSGFVVSTNLFTVLLSDQSIIATGTYPTFDGNTRNGMVLFSSTPAMNIELNQTATFYGAYNNLNTLWRISDPIGAFDDSGVEFTITAGGQLQYTSSDLGGTPGTQEMRFLIRGL